MLIVNKQTPESGVHLLVIHFLSCLWFYGFRSKNECAPNLGFFFSYI